MELLKDPKVLVGSVVDGAIIVIETVPKVGENTANVASQFASQMDSNLDSLKGQLPDNPGALPAIALKAIGETINAPINFFKGIGDALNSTVNGVQAQISRGTGG